MKSLPCVTLFLLLTLVFGCQPKGPNRQVLARVNSYEITKDEFRQEFKKSIFGAQDNLKSQKEFLNHLINQKLILQDAQEKGLDKEKVFLKAIESFWEQTLLKAALDKRIKELSGSFSVTEGEMRSLYNRRKEAGIINEPYETVSSLLRREISRNKETQALSVWIDQLRGKAKIQINEGPLK